MSTNPTRKQPVYPPARSPDCAPCTNTYTHSLAPNRSPQSVLQPHSTKQQPAAYIQVLVNDAIYFCNKNGRETAAKQFSSFEQVDEQWYVFIFDENSAYLAALFTRLIGRDFSRLKDVNDINCSEHIASVMTAGKWFSYFFPNP